MKKFCSKLLVVTAVACAVVLAGCGRQMPEQDGKKQEQESKKQEKEAAYEASIISDYEWQASGDGSIIVCDEDGAFKYYRSAEDLTDSYYGITVDELEDEKLCLDIANMNTANYALYVAK